MLSLFPGGYDILKLTFTHCAIKNYELNILLLMDIKGIFCRKLIHTYHGMLGTFLDVSIFKLLALQMMHSIYCY